MAFNDTTHIYADVFWSHSSAFIVGLFVSMTNYQFSFNVFFCLNNVEQNHRLILTLSSETECGYRLNYLQHMERRLASVLDL